MRAWELFLQGVGAGLGYAAARAVGFRVWHWAYLHITDNYGSWPWSRDYWRMRNYGGR